MNSLNILLRNPAMISTSDEAIENLYSLLSVISVHYPDLSGSFILGLINQVQLLGVNAKLLKSSINYEQDVVATEQGLLVFAHCVADCLVANPDLVVEYIPKFLMVLKSLFVSEKAGVTTKKAKTSKKSLPVVDEPFSELMIYLSLQTIGYMGKRKFDFKTVTEEDVAELVQEIFQSLSSISEDMQEVAASALGSVAVGNTEAYLPKILERIQYLLENKESNNFKRQIYLMLIALSEVILHISVKECDKYLDILWDLLFGICDSISSGKQKDKGSNRTVSGEESSLNIISECISKMVSLNPHR